MAQALKADNIIRTEALGKRYRSFWALQDCTITVPAGSIAALVGPNGAGKSTLLKLLVGLSNPSQGRAEVFGQQPSQDGTYLTNVGYLAQDIPLYKQLTAADHITAGAHLNHIWDSAFAEQHLTKLNIPLKRPVDKLSGGQRAQVGLALALAKRPRLLLLDEPVAALDPLAREDFLTSLTQAVAAAEGALTVVMSSHLLEDLERISDHLIILAGGKTQLCDSVEKVLASHKLLIGHADLAPENRAYDIIEAKRSSQQQGLLVCLRDPHFASQDWQMHDVNAEEVALAYMKQSRQQTKNERSDV